MTAPPITTLPRAARLLRLCSPAGQEDFFLEMGIRLLTRTAPLPKLSEAEEKAFKAKAEALGPKYKTELLK